MPGQQAIRDARVLIVGAGGLGSPVALYLAAAGVKKIGIADADTVSLSNLQRQIIHSTVDIGRLKVDSARDSMKALNPDVEVKTYAEFITPENAKAIISGYDIVADCCDNLDSRLLVSDTCVELGLPYVYAAVQRWSGHVFTHVKGSAAFRDFFGQPEPMEELPCALEGILNTVVGVTGSLQATEILKVITGTGDLLTDRILTFDAITMEFNTFTL